jgi:GDP-mannose 6-dehydrogenase
MERQLPQIDKILRSTLEEVLNESELVIVCQKRPEFAAALQGLDGRLTVLDLVRLRQEPALPGTSKYRGISW